MGDFDGGSRFADSGKDRVGGGNGIHQRIEWVDKLDGGGQGCGGVEGGCPHQNRQAIVGTQRRLDNKDLVSAICGRRGHPRERIGKGLIELTVDAIQCHQKIHRRIFGFDRLGIEGDGIVRRAKGRAANS